MKAHFLFYFLICCCFACSTTKSIENKIAYFPPKNKEWATIPLEKKRWNKAKLGTALDYAKAQKSSGILIVKNGKILVETYWDISKSLENPLFKDFVPGKTPDGRLIEDVASLQKSVVSLLVGIANGKGLLDLNASVSSILGEEWSNATKSQEGSITVTHLLNMTSGLDVDLNFAHPVGTHWQYNNMTYSQIIKILELITKKDINTLTKTWLGDQIGIQESYWGQRPERFPNRHGYMATHRDLARLGLLVLNKGFWQKKEVIQNAVYLKKALSPSQHLNRQYGYLYWLNTDKSSIPSGEADMICMRGALNRYVYIAPSLDLVVVRLGDEADRSFYEDFWALLVAAMP